MMEIEYIEDQQLRNVVFSQRRRALFKETGDYCNGLAGTRGAAIVFSTAGNIYEFGDPHEVVYRCYAAPSEAPPSKDRLGTMLVEALRSEQPAWGAIVRELGLQELGELEAAANKIKSVVAEEMKKKIDAGGIFKARWDVS